MNRTKPIHYAFTIVFAVPTLVTLSACGLTTALGNAWAGAPAGATCTAPESIWECNLVPGGANALPGEGTHNHIYGENCGSWYCATGESNALALTGANGTPGLTCINSAYDTPTWSACIAPPACDPCSDGLGGTLQSVGEPCAAPAEFATRDCCAGLVCQDPNTGQPLMTGTTSMGVCAGTLQPCSQAQPTLVPLTTTRLRVIAAANGIGAGQTGITQSRTIGLAFQTWVLFMLPQTENKMLYSSQARQMANHNKGGLPGSVIPDYVTTLDLFVTGQKVAFPFENSKLGEVKAVTGTLTSASNQSQILGLFDVTSQSPAGKSTDPNHMPPALVFTTTGNTTLGSDVPTTANQYSVAVWQQLVYEDQNDPNPELYLWDTVCLNPMIYGVPVVATVQHSGAHSQLTAPMVQLTPIPGDPDPPEVD